MAKTKTITEKAQKRIEEVTTMLLTELDGCAQLIKEGITAEGIKYLKEAADRMNKAVANAEKLFPKFDQPTLFPED